MVGPDEGGPQTAMAVLAGAAVRLQRRVHAGQPLGRFAHARDYVDTGAGHAWRAAASRTGPRAHVSDEEARKPHPDLPPDQRALLVTGEPGHPEERWIDAEAAAGAGYTLVDLSDDWTPFIFAEQTDGRRAAAAQPLPPHLPRSGQRPAGRGRRAARARRQELPRALRHPAVAVGAARALRARTNSTPATIRRAPRRSRRSRPSPTSRPPTSRRTSGGWRRCATSWRRRAARRGSRRWRSWRRSSRRWRPR